MKIGNFLFPDRRDPALDGAVIDETLREAWLSDELGVDVIWLAEHHFDGICAYVDPISFAGALATSTRRSKIGFAVVQTALHYLIRLAEQLALLDNITEGARRRSRPRLLLQHLRLSGLRHRPSRGAGAPGGGGADPGHCMDRRSVQPPRQVLALDVPMLRPRPYTKPHPALVRAASGEASMLELARQGRPFLMNVQSMAVTRRRVDLYRRAMQEAGYGEERIARTLAECWVWRNVFVAETNAEAERVGVLVFRAMVEARAALRNRIFRETGMRIAVPESDLPSPAPRSSTVLSTARRRVSPKLWRISTSSASAASSHPSASDRCRTRPRPAVSDCSWSRSHRKFAAATPRRRATRADFIQGGAAPAGLQLAMTRFSPPTADAPHARSRHAVSLGPDCRARSDRHIPFGTSRGAGVPAPAAAPNHHTSRA